MLDDVDDGNHKKCPDGFRDELSIYIYIYIYTRTYAPYC